MANSRLNIMSHLLKHIPCEELPRDKVKLPERQKPHGYKEPDYPYKLVPDVTGAIARDGRGRSHLAWRSRPNLPRTG